MAFKPPQGSTFRHPAVQAAMRALDEAVSNQGGAGAVGMTPFKHPDGSAFQDPKVRQGMQALGQMQAQDVPFKRSSGSAMDSPAVQRGMQALGQAQMQDAPFKRPSGSPLDSPAVRQGVGALGKLAEDAEKTRPAPGMTALRHPAKPDGLAGQKAEAASKIQLPNNSLYLAHNALNGGEISPEMLARWDQPRYQTGCEYLLNMVPMPQGGITKRPGLQYVGLGGTGTSRLFPFVFSAGESRVLEMIATGTNETGSTVKVWFPDGTSHSTGLALPYTGAEIAAVQMAQSADVLYIAHPNHPPAKIMRHADNDWRYTVIDWMPSISAPSFDTLWMAGDEPESGSQTTYRYVCTAIDAGTGQESMPSDAGSITAKNLSQSYYPCLQIDQVTGASEYRFYKYRAGVYGYIGSIYEGDDRISGISFGTDFAGLGHHYLGTMTRTIVNGDADLGVPDSDTSTPVTIAEDASQNAFLFPDAGKALVRVKRTTVTQTVGAVANTETSETDYFWALFSYTHRVQPGWGLTGAYSSYTTGSLGNSGEYPSGSVSSKSVAVYNAMYFEDRNIEPDTADTPPSAKNPFDGTGKYPACVFLHQQRLGWAASNNKPLTIWLSQAGNYESMAASLPPVDDDAIEAMLAAAQVNRILWCQSDRASLAIGTEGGEWILTGTDGAAITPSALSFQPQTYNGSEPGLPVLRVGAGLVYMQRGGHVVREFGYNFSSDKYESGDLSLLARHMLRGSSVVSWAWQGEPYGIIWCVLDNGKLAGLTYLREHDVVAWHRHETDGTVEDVTAIPGSDGNTQIWLHVVRNNVRYVERLAPFFNGGAASGAVHVDGVSLATFNARCVPSLPETSVQSGQNAPHMHTTFLRVRKVNAVKCRVVHSSPFMAAVGVWPFPSEPARPGAEPDVSNAAAHATWEAAVQAHDDWDARAKRDCYSTVPARGGPYIEGHADWAVPLASGWRENDRLELIFDGSAPATVLGIVTTTEVADEGGGQQ